VERTSSRTGLTLAVDHHLFTAHSVIRLHIQVTPRFQGRNRAAKGEGVRPIGKVGDSKLAYND
jgi:hypothetical protein